MSNLAIYKTKPKFVIDDNIVSVLAVIILSFTVIGDYVPGGILILRGSICMLFALCIPQFTFKIKFERDLFKKSIIIFPTYCLISNFWSYNSSQSIQKGKMLIGIAIVILALYHFYNKEKDVDKMLSVVMWCGYIVSIFVIIKYGYATIIMLLTGGIRISSDYINSNVIGMNASFSVFITAYYMMFHKFKIKYILVIPALLATIVSGSRKAFIILSVGIMFLLLFKMLYFKDNKSIREIGKTILLLFVTIVGLIYLNKINAFALLISRMDQILLFLNGTDKTFHSLSDRSALIDLGINAFHSSPLVGIGADCIGFVNGPYFGQDYYYSHNNFVEMLANGGIIGFCLYYYIYVYIIFSLIKYRDFHNKEYIVCVIFAALKIVLDYAYVSYDSRVTYFIIALLYIEARKIKKNKIWVW